MQIGQQIKKRRKELRLNLRELASMTDLTASFLSQIERNITSPSIDSLRRISEALDVPVFYFLLEINRPSPVVRQHERKKLILPTAKNITYEVLTPDSQSQIGIVMVELKAEDGPIPITQYKNTEECIYVLEGLMEIGLAGAVYELTKDDSVYFDGATLHYIAAQGKETLRFISITTPPIF